MRGLIYILILQLAPPLYRFLTALLFFSCRVRVVGRAHYEQCRDRGPFIGAVWHYSVLCAINNGMVDGEWVVMVSGSRDAELIARLLRQVGVETVRGSRGKGGLRAIQEMISLMKDGGRNAAIVVDGSQGPPRVAQAGAILLASRTGAPILPTAWAFSRYKAFHSWDRMVLPLPFSRMAVCYGEPLHVPAALKAADLEAWRLQLEQRLNQIYGQAWGLFGRERHDGEGG